MPQILATQEAEIKRLEIQKQSGKIVHESLEKTHNQKGAGVESQSVGPEFTLTCCVRKKKFH
jgi:hypothetical protein